MVASRLERGTIVYQPMTVFRVIPELVAAREAVVFEWNRRNVEIRLAEGLVMIARERTARGQTVTYPASCQSTGVTTKAKAPSSDLAFMSNTKFSQLKCPPTKQAENTEPTLVPRSEDSPGNLPSLFRLQTSQNNPCCEHRAD